MLRGAREAGLPARGRISRSVMEPTSFWPPRFLTGPPRTTFPAKGYKTWIEGCSAGRLTVNTTAFRVLRFNPGWSRATGTCPATACDSDAISSAGDKAAWQLASIKTWGDALYNQFVYVLPDPPCGFSVRRLISVERSRLVSCGCEDRCRVAVSEACAVARNACRARARFLARRFGCLPTAWPWGISKPSCMRCAGQPVEGAGQEACACPCCARADLLCVDVLAAEAAPSLQLADVLRRALPLTPTAGPQLGSVARAQGYARVQGH
jgi:hypothetical protein